MLYWNKKLKRWRNLQIIDPDNIATKHLNVYISKKKKDNKFLSYLFTLFYLFFFFIFLVNCIFNSDILAYGNVFLWKVEKVYLSNSIGWYNRQKTYFIVTRPKKNSIFCLTVFVTTSICPLQDAKGNDVFWNEKNIMSVLLGDSLIFQTGFMPLLPSLHIFIQ